MSSAATGAYSCFFVLGGCLWQMADLCVADFVRGLRMWACACLCFFGDASSDAEFSDVRYWRAPQVTPRRGAVITSEGVAALRDVFDVRAVSKDEAAGYVSFLKT